MHSAAPSDNPLIQPNYLDQKPDLDHLVAAVKLGRRLLDSDAFAPHRRDEFKPDAAGQSDNDIRNFIRAEAETIYHPVGTCRMGPDPAEAVVDDRLRVHGMRGLRVVDASIMPWVPRGNTNIPTLMIAEKIATTMLGE